MTRVKVKPKYLSKRGKREFVVLTVEDFDRMQAALEDANDLATLRAATRKNRKGPYLTPKEVQRQLSTRSTQKRKAS